MSKNNLCNETWGIMFIKMTAKSKLNSQLGLLSVAQLLKIPFIVFRLARFILTGQTSHLNMVYP